MELVGTNPKLKKSQLLLKIHFQMKFAVCYSGGRHDSRLIFVCRCGQSAARNVVLTLAKKPRCLVFSRSKSIPGAGRAKLLKSKYRGDVFMCMCSTPKADGWEMRWRRIRQRPSGGLAGVGQLLEFTSALTIQELSGTISRPCHGKTDGDAANLGVCHSRSESREGKRTKRTWHLCHTK